MTMDSAPDDRHAGMMLVELLVTLVILGLVGAAITGLFFTQSRFFGTQDAKREARSASRSAVNVMLSELRMVEAIGGLVSAEEQSVSLRVPYALGVVCSASSTEIVASLFPTDNVGAADGLSSAGYAWRDDSGVYHYRTASAGAASAAACTGAGIAIVPNGQAVKLEPGDASAPSGAPLFLYRRITYDFRPVAGVPGNVELWRKEEGSSVVEEPIGGPFDGASSRFRYFVLDGAEPEDVPPANPAEIRGLEFVLDGRSERPAPGGGETHSAKYATAVFFHNR